MNPIASLKRSISSNIYAYDAALRLRSAKRNHTLRKAFRKVYPIDPFEDFDVFREAVIALKGSCHRYADWLELSLPCADSLFYGHLHALAEYAGVPYDGSLRLLMPSVEHGIHWLDEPCPFDAAPHIHNMVSQGAYRHGTIRSSRSIPHYVVGPYIHYARPSYDAEELSRLKKTMGRTLLVFPSHTYEAGNSSYERRQYTKLLMDRFSENFETILVSCYWNDVDDEVFHIFKSEGARVFSCGLRSDPQFIKRLKSALLLSDCVTGNSLGTHIGYAIALDKPFVFLDGGSPAKLQGPSAFSITPSDERSSMDSLTSDAKALFASSGKAGAISAIQKAFCLPYWGDKSDTKKPEQIAAIFEISQDMLSLSKGNVHRFDKAYQELLITYQNDPGVVAQSKASLLGTALS